jgi:hypothetical protein
MVIAFTVAAHHGGLDLGISPDERPVPEVGASRVSSMGWIQFVSMKCYMEYRRLWPMDDEGFAIRFAFVKGLR